MESIWVMNLVLKKDYECIPLLSKLLPASQKFNKSACKVNKTRNHINILTENRGHKSKIKVRSHSKEVLQNEIELKYGNFDEERDFLMNTPDLRYSIEGIKY